MREAAKYPNAKSGHEIKFEQVLKTISTLPEDVANRF